jgi:hypothetical protein
MISFLGTIERFVGEDSMPYGEDKEGSFNWQYWNNKPLNTWPRDDAEAKLVATAIATYNYNNYIAPKAYCPHSSHDPDEIASIFKMRDPMFIPGMAWKGTHPSFYKIWIGSDLVRSVGKGRYPRTPTKVYKYTPMLPEEPKGGMDKLCWNAMKPLANRKVVIGCLEAFKMFFEAKRL